jgi:hypothetical protein
MGGGGLPQGCMLSGEHRVANALVLRGFAALLLAHAISIQRHPLSLTAALIHSAVRVLWHMHQHLHQLTAGAAAACSPGVDVPVMSQPSARLPLASKQQLPSLMLYAFCCPPVVQDDPGRGTVPFSPLPLPSVPANIQRHGWRQLGAAVQ